MRSTVPYHTSQSLLSPVIATCPDCGDLGLEFTNYPCRALADGLQLQCAACEQYELDDAAAKARAARHAVDILTAGVIRTGGLNDERYVPCEECGDTAVTYAADVHAPALDGKAACCESCRTVGKIVLDDDEGQAFLMFRAYTQREIAALDLLGGAL